MSELVILVSEPELDIIVEVWVMVPDPAQQELLHWQATEW